MDALVRGDMLPLMVLLDTDVVRMLKIALPPVPELVLLPLMVLLSTVSVPSPLAMPPPPSLFLPDEALPLMIASWPRVTLAAGETLNTWLAFLPSTVVTPPPAPWTVMVLAVRDSTPSFRGKVPAGTKMVITLPLGWASASCTAARRVHCPDASAQMPSPGDTSGASVVLVT